MAITPGVDLGLAMAAFCCLRSDSVAIPDPTDLKESRRARSTKLDCGGVDSLGGSLRSRWSTSVRGIRRASCGHRCWLSLSAPADQGRNVEAETGFRTIASIWRQFARLTAYNEGRTGWTPPQNLRRVLNAYPLGSEALRHRAGQILSEVPEVDTIREHPKRPHDPSDDAETLAGDRPSNQLEKRVCDAPGLSPPAKAQTESG